MTATTTTTWTSGGHPVPYVPVLEDPAAAHQIVLTVQVSRLIVVSCTCLIRGGRHGQHRQVIALRAEFPAADALAAWRTWHADREIKVGT
jgi:hypothetical protein